MIALVGCHELGHVDGDGDYGRASGHLMGEVNNVNTWAREIEIKSERGRSRIVRYDGNTRVVYRQRNYEVADLERGDYVAIRTQEARDGSFYTDLITVRESAQDRGAAGKERRLDRVAGRVEYVDPRRGTFEVRDGRDRLVVVSVAFNAARTVVNRFNRLHEGDYVRLEGQFVDRDRFELEKFL